MKRQFGYCKAAYRGLRKNLNLFYMLFASVNLLKVLQGGLSSFARSLSDLRGKALREDHPAGSRRDGKAQGG